jgi:hypothetical protein
MSEKEVQTVYGGSLERWATTLKTVYPKAASDRSFPHFGIQHFDVDGCDFYVDFIFEKERLYQVILGLNDNFAFGCGIKIADILTSKYGKPSVDEKPLNPNADERIRAWFLGPTRIRQHTSYYKAAGSLPSRVFVSLRYEKAITPGAGKL